MFAAPARCASDRSRPRHPTASDYACRTYVLVHAASMDSLATRDRVTTTKNDDVDSAPRSLIIVSIIVAHAAVPSSVYVECCRPPLFSRQSYRRQCDYIVLLSVAHARPRPVSVSTVRLLLLLLLFFRLSRFNGPAPHTASAPDRSLPSTRVNCCTPSSVCPSVRRVRVLVSFRRRSEF